MSPLCQFNCFKLPPHVCLSICLYDCLCVYILLIWKCVSLFESLLGIYFRLVLWMELHTLEIALYAFYWQCRYTGRMQWWWWGGWRLVKNSSNWLLLVSKTRCNVPGIFDLVLNRTAYTLLWYFFTGFCDLISPMRLSYLSTWDLPVVVGPFHQGWIWLVTLLWSCKTVPLILPPLPMKSHFLWCWRVWGFPHWILWCH